MRHRLLAIACLASALTLSQHANATAPPTEVSFRAEHKEVAMQPKDTVPIVDYQSTAATFVVPSFQEPNLLVHRDTVATFPTINSAHRAPARRVAQEVDAQHDAVIS